MAIFGDFAKAIVSQNGRKWLVLGVNVKVLKTYENNWDGSLI